MMNRQNTAEASDYSKGFRVFCDITKGRFPKFGLLRRNVLKKQQTTLTGERELRRDTELLEARFSTGGLRPTF